MTAHDPEHERALDRILASDHDPWRAFRSSPLAPCHACARIVGGVLATEARVADAGRRERANLASLARERTGEGRAERGLRAHIRTRESPDGAAAPHRRPWGGLLALAAASVLVWGKPHDPLPIDVPDPVLSAGAVELAHPVGSVEGYSPFEWEATLPSGGWFEVRVHVDEAGRPGALLGGSGRLEATRWEPSVSESSAWPEHIVWTLEVVRRTDPIDLDGPYCTRASRSP
ncbi:MAG: hypothetical protein GY711_29775 [bacterium]|nr:hypothetical protein [bacterium]